MADAEDSPFKAPEIRRRPLRANEELRIETLRQQHGGGLAAELSVRGAAEVLGSLPDRKKSGRRSSSKPKPVRGSLQRLTADTPEQAHSDALERERTGNPFSMSEEEVARNKEEVERAKRILGFD